MRPLESRISAARRGGREFGSSLMILRRDPPAPETGLCYFCLGDFVLRGNGPDNFAGNDGGTVLRRVSFWKGVQTSPNESIARNGHSNSDCGAAGSRPECRLIPGWRRRPRRTSYRDRGAGTLAMAEDLEAQLIGEVVGVRRFGLERLPVSPERLVFKSVAGGFPRPGEA